MRARRSFLVLAVLAGILPNLPAVAESPVRLDLPADRMQGAADDATRMLAAAEEGDAAALRAALRRGVSVNSRSRTGDSALNLAVGADHADLVPLILEFKPEIDHRGAMGLTALGQATLHRQRGIIDRLLRADADVNIADAAGVTPLAAALRLGYLELARVFLAEGAEVNLADLEGNAALHALARSDLAAPDPACRPLAMQLIARGANPNAMNRQGHPPLYLALLSHNDEVAKVLIENPQTDIALPVDGHSLASWVEEKGTDPVKVVLRARLGSARLASR